MSLEERHYCSIIGHGYVTPFVLSHRSVEWLYQEHGEGSMIPRIESLHNFAAEDLLLSM
jgi:hypothetical protein